jgi:hypothetical protein
MEADAAAERAEEAADAREDAAKDFADAAEEAGERAEEAADAAADSAADTEYLLDLGDGVDLIDVHVLLGVCILLLAFVRVCGDAPVDCRHGPLRCPRRSVWWSAGPRRRCSAACSGCPAPV